MSKAPAPPRHRLGVDLGRLRTGLFDRRHRVHPAAETSPGKACASLITMAFDSWQQAKALATASEELAANLHVLNECLAGRTYACGIQSEAQLQPHDPVQDLTGIAGHLEGLSRAIRETADNSSRVARNVHAETAARTEQPEGREALVRSIQETAHVTHTCIHAIRDLTRSVHLLESICRSLSSTPRSEEMGHVADTAFMLEKYLTATEASIRMTPGLTDRAALVWTITATMARHLTELTEKIGEPASSGRPPALHHLDPAHIPRNGS